MARLPDLVEFGREHGLKIGTIADLIEYRSANESLIERVAERVVRTVHGEFRLMAYRDKAAGAPHVALAMGDISPGHEAMVRVHEPVTIFDLLDVGAGTHSWSVHSALGAIARHGNGALVFLNCAQPGEELFGQFETLARYETDQSERERAARRTGRMDLRNYGIGAQILRDLGVGRMRLLANPRKMPSMVGYGLEITGFEPGN